MSFPNINIPESLRNRSWHQNYVTAAIEFWQSSDRLSCFDDNYKSYNSTEDEITKKYISNRYGKKLTTKFVDFNLPRNKIKIIANEFLDMNLQATISSVNPESISKRLSKRHFTIGMSSAKKTLEKVRQKSGIKPFGGVKIPEYGSAKLLDIVNTKSKAEIVMQKVSDDKVKNEKLKNRFYRNLTHLLLTSECHGVVEKDSIGVDTFRVILPDFAIFQEHLDDEMVKNSPFKGEVVYMFRHEIIAEYGDKVSLKKLDEIFEGGDAGEHLKVVGGQKQCPVYKIQWKVPKKLVWKETPVEDSDVPIIRIMSGKKYEKQENQINKDVEAGKYSIDVTYVNTLHYGHSIGKDYLVRYGEKPDVQQQIGTNGKYEAMFDYKNLLLGTVKNTRTPLITFTESIRTIYNVTMFQIMNELRSMKSGIIAYDEAYKPKLQSMTDVIYEMYEHNTLKYNSSSDGNLSETDLKSARDIVKSIKLGDADILRVLLELKNQLEITLDRLTGINDAREGFGQQGMTATATMRNLDASRSITKDIFYFLNEFIAEVLLHLIDKAKDNTDYIKQLGDIIYGSSEAEFLETMKEISLDQLGIFVTDGKKELQVRQKMEELFPGEINSGKLRAKDVAKFEMSDSITEGLAILDLAWKEIESVSAMQMKSKEKIEAEKGQMALKLAQEDREDKQEHEKELTILEGAVEKDNIMVREGLKTQQNREKSQSDLAKENLKKQ